jgi:hypothetical protein
MFSFGSQQGQVPKISSNTPTFGAFQPSFGIQQQQQQQEGTGKSFPTSGMAFPLTAANAPGGGGMVPGSSIGTPSIPLPSMGGGFGGGMTPASMQPSLYGTSLGLQPTSSSMIGGNLFESTAGPNQGFLFRPQQPSAMTTTFGTPMGPTGGLLPETSIGSWGSSTTGPFAFAPPGTIVPSSGRIDV